MRLVESHSSNLFTEPLFNFSQQRITLNYLSLYCVAPVAKNVLAIVRNVIDPAQKNTISQGFYTCGTCYAFMRVRGNCHTLWTRIGWLYINHETHQAMCHVTVSMFNPSFLPYYIIMNLSTIFMLFQGYYSIIGLHALGPLLCLSCWNDYVLYCLDDFDCDQLIKKHFFFTVLQCACMPSVLYIIMSILVGLFYLIMRFIQSPTILFYS